MKNVLFPGLGDAIGFRLNVMQELNRSTLVHIIYKFVDLKLWQETGIPPPPILTPTQPTRSLCNKGKCNDGIKKKKVYVGYGKPESAESEGCLE
jgi:hypothetical protein